MHATLRALPLMTKQVVYDFSNSAIALRRYFGEIFVIRQVLDLQLAYEALDGRVGADVVSVLRAFGQQVSYSDAAHRCPLFFCLVLSLSYANSSACLP